MILLRAEILSLAYWEPAVLVAETLCFWHGLVLKFLSLACWLYSRSCLVTLTLYLGWCNFAANFEIHQLCFSPWLFWLLWRLLNFELYMCTSVMGHCPRRQEHLSPQAGTVHDCESLAVGSGNWTLVLYEKQTPLTADLSLQSHILATLKS